MSVSLLVKDAYYTVGEGPHWEESSKSLLYVDIPNGEVHRYDNVTGTDSKIKLDGTVGFVIPRKAGGYVIGQNKTVATLEWGDTIKTEPITEVEKGCETRFNDGKCDPSGRLWAGTMALKPGADGTYSPTAGTLYSMDTDRSLATKFSPVGISNGLAWSSDRRLMYYVDSVPRKIYTFDFDIGSGKIANCRVLLDYNALGQEYGFPDGMCIDEDDKLWVACFGGDRIIRVDPATGTVLRNVSIPAHRITSCSFGGPDYTELFVTSARLGSTPNEISKFPHSGGFFKVTGLGVKGLAAPDFGG